MCVVCVCVVLCVGVGVCFLYRVSMFRDSIFLLAVVPPDTEDELACMSL